MSEEKLELTLKEVANELIATIRFRGPHKTIHQYVNKLHQQVRRYVNGKPLCLYHGGNARDGYDLEVRHFLEVVVENISSRRLRFPRKVRAAYHDSCQLVRHLGLVEEPRRILRSIEGIELVETDWTKGEWATCCGGGGGFEAVFPALSQVLAVNRAGELLETGAEIIVTHCPGCVIQLKDGLKELKANSVEVLDLAQIIAMAMET